MIISGAWNIEALPNHYVVEVPGAGLKLFFINPMREIAEDDLTPYNGHHPRKLRGVPMPEYLYRFYGLEKSKETASETVRVRLTPMDKAEVERRAKEAGLSVSEYLRQLATARD